MKHKKKDAVGQLVGPNDSNKEFFMNSNLCKI